MSQVAKRIDLMLLLNGPSVGGYITPESGPTHITTMTYFLYQPECPKCGFDKWLQSDNNMIRMCPRCHWKMPEAVLPELTAFAEQLIRKIKDEDPTFRAACSSYLEIKANEYWTKGENNFSYRAEIQQLHEWIAILRFPVMGIQLLKDLSAGEKNMSSEEFEAKTVELLERIFEVMPDLSEDYHCTVDLLLTFLEPMLHWDDEKEDYGKVDRISNFLNPVFPHELADDEDYGPFDDSDLPELVAPHSNYLVKAKSITAEELQAIFEKMSGVSDVMNGKTSEEIASMFKLDEGVED